jgi:Lon protease-like protein
MSERPGGTALPLILPIFPLTGVLLLPRGRLPLNIFEPRYLAMTREWNEQAARKQLVKFFEIMGSADPLTLSARRRLSALMFS